MKKHPTEDNRDFTSSKNTFQPYRIVKINVFIEIRSPLIHTYIQVAQTKVRRK